MKSYKFRQIEEILVFANKISWKICNSRSARNVRKPLARGETCTKELKLDYSSPLFV